MTPLNREETVWLRAYLKAKCDTSVADFALEEFKKRFTPSPPPQKESVSGVAQDRREFWLEINPYRVNEKIYISSRGAALSGRKLIHVTELRPGEVIVTREMLAKAWDDQVANKVPVINYPSKTNFFFDAFCKALGLSHE